MLVHEPMMPQGHYISRGILIVTHTCVNEYDNVIHRSRGYMESDAPSWGGGGGGAGFRSGFPGGGGGRGGGGGGGGLRGKTFQLCPEYESSGRCSTLTTNPRCR